MQYELGNIIMHQSMVCHAAFPADWYFNGQNLPEECNSYCPLAANLHFIFNDLSHEEKFKYSE